MSVDWHAIAKAYWDQQPHPKDPSGKITIAEFSTAVKLATLVKFGGHASGHETALFWPEFKATGLSPGEFEHAVDRIAPVSFTYHGRPPTMREIVELKDKHPKEVNSYFSELPDKHYPHVTAGNMVKAMQAAAPHAQEHLKREPVKLEAAYLHHSGEKPEVYYQKLGAQAKLADSTNVVSLEDWRNPGGRSSRDSGGQTPDQRVAPH